MHDVIILGSGISGYAAAHHLRGVGISTLMLEARGRDGGRTYTDHSFVDFGVEKGAEFLHDLNSDVGQIIQQQGLRTVDWPKTDEMLYRIHGQLLTMREARRQNPAFEIVRGWDLPG